MSPGADFNLAHGVVAWRPMDREQAPGEAITFNVRRWSVGVLECWSVGVLECWSVGVLV
jgi:hypothetical protein